MCPDKIAPTAPTAPADGTHIDALVIGAGFGGLRMLYELRHRGIPAIVLEAGSDIGGTWYWNRYPGARTDTEGICYSAFSFSAELNADWCCSERFPSQPEILDYLRFVADRLELRSDIYLNQRVRSAVFDEAATVWAVTTEQGLTVTCDYLIPAVGNLSAPLLPEFPGLDRFRGDWYQTSLWPQEPPDFAGKRVAVIGTGATGVQVIPVIAHTAESLTVFQRTPNYVLPARNYSVTDEEKRAARVNYEQTWEQARSQLFAFAMDDTTAVLDDYSPAEQQRVLRAGWEAGGFRFLFETFADILVNPAANQVAADFVRDQIRSIVKDPVTAEALCPVNHPLGGKRPPLGHFYYETYNRANVHLVDISKSPITEVTTTTIRVGDIDYEVDAIVFATGFDAVTGSLTRIDIRGRGGMTIGEKWRDGPRTYLGIGVDGFPNMFLINGPQGPFANIPPVIELAVEWIGAAITHAKSAGGAVLEATAEAVAHWCQHVEDLINGTVLADGARAAGSWYMGANVPGKAQVPLMYFGGYPAFEREARTALDNGFEGFEIAPALEQTPA